VAKSKDNSGGDTPKGQLQTTRRDITLLIVAEIDFGVAFQPNRFNTQKEEVDGVPCDEAQVSNHQSTIRKGSLNNHTVSKHQSDRNSTKRSQKGSASDSYGHWITKILTQSGFWTTKWVLDMKSLFPPA